MTWLLYHETVIRTEITCKESPLNSECLWNRERLAINKNDQPPENLIHVYGLFEGGKKW